MPEFIDLTGQTFTRWTVLRRDLPDRSNKHIYWVCRCECGVERAICTTNLRRGVTQSCGCLARERASERAKHGLTRNAGHAPEYGIWENIKQRVSNPNNHAFDRYGGRGITICERWRKSAVAFYTDMGPRPTLQHSIERRNNNGHYSCGRCWECKKRGWIANCYWATQLEQCLNRRSNVRLTFRGRTLTISQWAEETGIGDGTLRYRRKIGWPIERILTEPVKHNN